MRIAHRHWGCAAASGLLLLLFASTALAQDKANGKGPPLIRPAPSAVTPTDRTFVATAILVGSVFAAGIFIGVLRSMAPRPAPMKKAADVIPVVTPAPEWNFAAGPRQATFTLPHAPWVDTSDSEDLPANPLAHLATAQMTIAIAVMDAFARVLRSAKKTSEIGARLYRTLRPALVAWDDQGASWTVGTKTGTWYRLEGGTWIARMPPARLFLDEIVFQKLIDLQAAFPSAR